MRLQTPPRAAVRVSLCALVLLGLTACSADEPTGPGTPSSTPATSATASPSPSSTDQAELEALFARYWDATTQAYAGPNTDPALWRGVVTDEVAQQQIALTQEYVDHNVTYTGEPRTVSLDVQITGETALLTGCVDQSEWVAASTTEVLPSRGTGVYPSVLTAQRFDGVWLVTSDNGPADGVTC